MENTKIAKNNEKKNMQNGLKTYFRGVKSEWGKVTWPEKNQVIVETGIVIFVVAFFTIMVFLLDKIFISLLGLIAK